MTEKHRGRVLNLAAAVALAVMPLQKSWAQVPDGTQWGAGLRHVASEEQKKPNDMLGLVVNGKWRNTVRGNGAEVSEPTAVIFKLVGEGNDVCSMHTHPSRKLLFVKEMPEALFHSEPPSFDDVRTYLIDYAEIGKKDNLRFGVTDGVGLWSVRANQKGRLYTSNDDVVRVLDKKNPTYQYFVSAVIAYIKVAARITNAREYASLGSGERIAVLKKLPEFEKLIQMYASLGLDVRYNSIDEAAHAAKPCS